MQQASLSRQAQQREQVTRIGPGSSSPTVNAAHIDREQAGQLSPSEVGRIAECGQPNRKISRKLRWRQPVHPLLPTAHGSTALTLRNDYQVFTEQHCQTVRYPRREPN